MGGTHSYNWALQASVATGRVHRPAAHSLPRKLNSFPDSAPTMALRNAPGCGAAHVRSDAQPISEHNDLWRSFRTTRATKQTQLAKRFGTGRTRPPLRPQGFLVYITIVLYGPAVTVRTARFSIHKCYVLPTQCIYVFCVDLRSNSDYFPIQH
jgi:hypothetical protein